MSESKYPDWYHGPRGPSDEVKAQRKISARLKRIEAKLDAIGTAPQRPKADPLTNDIPLRRSEKWPAPVPQTEGDRDCPDCGGLGRRAHNVPAFGPCPVCASCSSTEERDH